MKSVTTCVIAIAQTLTVLAAAAEPAPAVTPEYRQQKLAQPNVLFMAIDDLNDWVGCLGGHPLAKTPHIDSLAARGTLFTNAHCQAPLCNPSRASLLTGLRPSTTGIHGLAPGIRTVDVTKNRVTLPQHFAISGYETFTCGKIFHDGSIALVNRATEVDQWGPAPGMPGLRPKLVDTPDGHPAVDWGVTQARDEEQADWKIADAAIARIQAAKLDKPFFIAAGFRLPHVPCYATQKWFDLYPDDDTVLPPIKPDDRSDVPPFAWYLHWDLPEPRLAWLQKANQLRALSRAYLATTSFVDSQVGRVLGALDKSGQAERTIIVLWSDHGWHLGEKEITGKNSLWERSTRVPLIIAGPGVSTKAKCDQPAELLDIYPTLIELCGLPSREGLEGHSLTPQLKDASLERTQPAITTHNQGNHAVRSRHWRYIRYADGSEELYDHRNDPNEWTNLASDPQHAKTLREHAAWLPKIDVPAAPGSKHRILAGNAQDGWQWEGKLIDPKLSPPGVVTK